MKLATEFSSREKPLIIPIFIMNKGCPQLCVFCNQKIAAGNFAKNLSANHFQGEVASYLRWNKNKNRPIEIAFYGGNFTGLSFDEQKRLLDMAGNCLKNYPAASIRISTRPDYIDEEQLNFLCKRGVKTVEIGAQSLNDDVLFLAGRGHDAQATVKAMKLLKKHNLQTSLHLMAGLPGDSRSGFAQTLRQTVELQPDAARIHPTIVLANTRLAEEYQAGRYLPLSLEEAVDWCRLGWDILTPAGIRIIRFGLQISPEMTEPGAVLAGPLHPSFGSLVQASVFYRATLSLLGNIPNITGMLRFRVSKRDLCHFCGVGNQNIKAIKKLYPHRQIVIDSFPQSPRGRLAVDIGTEKTLFADIPEI